MQQLAALGVDYAGMIFYPGSKRFVGDTLTLAKEEIKKIAIKKIGVFVNANRLEVLEAISIFGLDGVQLHGDEKPEYCRQLMDETTVVKALRIGADSDIDSMIAPYADACHFYLFDTATENYGGSGKHFDWRLLDNATVGKPFFLSGGISVSDVEAIKKMDHPFLYSIDINSRFEIAPGIKDPALIQTFLEELK